MFTGPSIISPADIDEDGIPDDMDNCRFTANPDQGDCDGDGLGNLCDIFDGCGDGGGSDRDSDDDGVEDAQDNCANEFNPDQVDRDSDGIGDRCDPDNRLDPDPEPCPGDADCDGDPDDSDCAPDDDSIYSGQTEICDDGVDNNCDGLTDDDDPACVGCGDGACGDGETPCNCADDCGSPPESEDCDQDGMCDANDPDDDNDGDPDSTDCADCDPDRSSQSVEICDDGIDNDCDGLIDCEDQDCRDQCGYIYFTRGGRIFRARLNGSERNDGGLIGIGPTVYGLDFDPIDEVIYYTALNNGNHEIRRYSINSSNDVKLVDAGGRCGDITVWNAANRIYWTEVNPSNRIMRASTSGANDQTVVSGLAGPMGIFVYPAIDKLYWSENSFPDRIRRANTSGSSIENLASGLNEPNHIAIDVPRGKVYWTDSDLETIQRANLDGSSVETVLSTGDVPWGIAVDSAGGKVYWVEFGENRIRRANLDGSEIETILDNAGEYDIALDLRGLP